MDMTKNHEKLFLNQIKTVPQPSKKKKKKQD